jgi:predicted RNase H-like nuclease (RuvC/YqgF family)
MIGCNSTDDELELREFDYTAELERRLKALEDENAILREEVRTLEREKSNLEAEVERLEDKIYDSITMDEW